MAADKWRCYDTFKEYTADGTIDLDTDTFKCALFLSTSNCATLTHNEYGDLTNEHANANGYTTGGATLTGVTFTNAAGVVTLDCDDITWTAAGGTITARFAVIYKSGTVGGVTNPLVAYSLLNNTPADTTAPDGSTFTVRISATGVLRYQGGNTA